MFAIIVGIEMQNDVMQTKLLNYGLTSLFNLLKCLILYNFFMSVESFGPVRACKRFLKNVFKQKDCSSMDLMHSPRFC